MKLYASSRRLFVLLTVATATALVPLAPQLTVAFPDVIGGGGGSVLPLAAITPLLLAITLAWSLAARRTHLGAAAVRRTELGDVAVLIGTDLLVTAISVLANGDLTVARNAAILTAGGAIITCLAGPAAGGAAVTVIVLLVVTYGRTAPGAGIVRVLQAAPDAPWPLALALALTLTACAALL